MVNLHLPNVAQTMASNIFRSGGGFNGRGLDSNENEVFQKLFGIIRHAPSKALNVRYLDEDILQKYLYGNPKEVQEMVKEISLLAQESLNDYSK